MDPNPPTLLPEEPLFLWRLTEGKESVLLEDLISRNYYKRVLELPLADFVNPNAVSNALTLKRVEFHDRLEKAMLAALMRAIQDQITIRESLREDGALSRVNEIAAEKHIFVADLPLRGWLASGEPLLVIIRGVTFVVMSACIR